MKQSSFDMFVSMTISNEYTHYVLIIIEYFLFIFPSIIDVGLKINLIQPFSIILKLFDYLHYNNNIYYYPCIIISITIVLLIIYTKLYFFGPMEANFNWLKRILANAYDLILFRYFSMLVFDSFIMLSIQIYKFQTPTDSVIAIIIILLLLIFIIVNYSFINQCFVLINISNPQLVNQPLKYPYDKLSVQYDRIMFLLKIVIAFEYNFSRLSEVIDIRLICLNIMIVLLSILLFIFMLIQNSFLYWNYSLILANVTHNQIRKGIALFNFIFIILGTFIFRSETNPIYILMLGVLTLNLTALLLFFENRYLKFYLLPDQGISFEIILFMLTTHSTDIEILKRTASAQDCCRRKHILICKSKSHCELCRQYSINTYNNIRVFYKYYKHYHRATTLSSLTTYEVPVYAEMIKLFYYKIQCKTFKFYHYYYRLIQKYNKTNREYTLNQRLLCELWLKKSESHNFKFISHILQVIDLEKRLIKLLNDMNKFLNQNMTLKSPETVIELSFRLSDIIENAKRLIESKHVSSSSYYNGINQLDVHNRTIDGAIEYSRIIIQYILETLTNQPISVIMPLKLFNLEDFLSLHYTSDKTLICSIDLSSLFYQDIEIVKVTGKLIGNEKNSNASLNHFFPKEIEDKEIEMFIGHMNTFQASTNNANTVAYITANTNTINTNINTTYNNKANNNHSNSTLKPKTESLTFSFPIVNKELIVYLEYKFLIMKMPQSSSLIIYGYYIEHPIYKKVILLDFNNPQIAIIGFCKLMIKLLQLKPEWLKLLKETRIKFYMTSIFTKITANENNSVIECEMNYNSYFKLYNYIIKELKTISPFTDNPKNKFQLHSLKTKMAKYTNEEIKLTLEKVCEYNKGISLFNIKVSTTSKETRIKPKNINTIADDTQDLNYLLNMHQCNSNSSLSDDSRGSHSHSKGKQNSKFNLLNMDLQKRISKETKKLSIFTFAMLGLNIILILICIVFLFTQINQTTQLSNLCNLYFDFKGIGWAQINYFLAVATTSCYAKDPNESNGCVNNYRRYIAEFRKNFSLPIEYDFLIYEYTAMSFKAEYGYNTLYQFNRLLHNFKDVKFKELMNTRINYYEFEEINGISSFVTQNISYDEGMRKYMNSLSIITKNTTGVDPYINLPIYFLNYFNGTYSFPKAAKNLNILQKEVYKIIANNINYFRSGEIGDENIRTNFGKLGDENYVMNIIFMVSIGALNLVLFFICRANINIAYYIFKSLIYNIVLETENKVNAGLIQHRMDNLLLVSKLYQKNPNSIIKEIETKTKLNAYSSSTNNNTNGNGSVNDNGKDSTKDQYTEKEANASSIVTNTEINKLISFGNEFYFTLLSKPLILLVSVFGLFFIIIIVFDIVLIVKFRDVLDFYNYVLITYDADHTLLSIVAMTTMSYISNVTDDEIAKLMNIKSYPDGALNEKIKENLELYTALLKYTDKNSTKYPSLSQYVDYEYDKVFLSMNDGYASDCAKILGPDYRIAKDYIVKAYQLINLPNFNYLRGDMVTRTLLLLNNKSKRDYEAIYEFTNDNEFYTLNTMAIMLFLPISKQNKHEILVPKLKENFSLYIILVGLYLAINICLEIVLFISMRWGITKNLNRIQTNLYMLNNCCSTL